MAVPVNLLAVLRRHLSANRRRHRRRRRNYDIAIITSDGRAVFRGRSLDLSKGGVRAAGLTHNTDLVAGQAVRVEFTLSRGDHGESLHWLRLPGRICRFEERNGEDIVAVQFEEPLPQMPK
jgi:hypothetical protein